MSIKSTTPNGMLISSEFHVTLTKKLFTHATDCPAIRDFTCKKYHKHILLGR